MFGQEGEERELLRREHDRLSRQFPGGISLLYTLIGTVIGAIALVIVGVIGPARSRRVPAGAVAGGVAGLVMGGVTMFIAAPILDLPWPGLSRRPVSGPRAGIITTGEGDIEAWRERMRRLREQTAG